MNDLRQAALQALETLENDAMQRTYAGGVRITNAAIALRAALAEPEQEPVAYFDPQEKGFYWAKPTAIKTPMTVSIEPLPLYSAPTPRKPLTDEEITDAVNGMGPDVGSYEHRLARAVIAAYEAKQGEQT